MIRLILLTMLLQSGSSPQPLAPPESVYTDALAAMEGQDWETAIAGFQTILAANPSDIPARFNLAVSLGEAGAPLRALDVYRELLTRDPSIFEARMNRAILLVETGRQEEAVEEFRAAAALRPGDPLPLLYRSQLLDQMRRNQAAIEGYTQVLGLDPNLREPHERLGLIYRRMGEDDAALRELGIAAEMDATDPAIFIAMGDIEAEAGRLDAAERAYEKARSLAPEDDDIQLRLAQVLLDLERLPEAIELLEKLPTARALLAQALMDLPDYARAATVLEELTVADSEDPDFWYMLGRAYYEGGRDNEAEDALKRSLGLRPERVSAWGALATIYLEREDWRNAGVVLSQYVGLDPDHAPSHFLLALCFDNLGNFDRALLHYNRFIELDDGSDDVRSFQVRQRAESLERYLIENP